MLRTLVSALTLVSSLALATPKNVDVKIDGMTCESCVKAVTAKLAQVPNIDKASIHVLLKEKKATLTVANADQAAMTAIKKAVADAGYKVVGEPQIIESK